MATAVVGYYSFFPGGIYDELGTAGAAEGDLAQSVCSGWLMSSGTKSGGLGCCIVKNINISTLLD